MIMSKSGAGDPRSYDVVIIGGGIAGLAAAHSLQQRAPHLGTLLVEGSNRLGGKLLTDYVHGFVVEGGADSFLASKPEAATLSRDLGLGDQLIGTNPEWRRTFVMKAGMLRRIPDGLTGLVPARLEPFLQSDLLSDAGKARLAREPQVPVRENDDEETLAAFIERRFGPEVYQRLIEPLMAGIYAGDGTSLGLNATFPQLRRLEQEYGSVTEGLRAATPSSTQTAGALPTPSAFLTLRQGMGHIVATLSSALRSVHVKTDTRVLSVHHHEHGYRVQSAEGNLAIGRAVIVAVPAYRAAEILEAVVPNSIDDLDSIPYVSTASVALAYRTSDMGSEPDGFGYIVPRAENRSVLACTWSSHKFDFRAPRGYFLARAFIGRAGREDILTLSDEDLIGVARAEMRDVSHIEAAPEFTRIYRWPLAMPQYTVGHLDRVRRIETNLRAHPGLFVAGHAFGGVGVPDCIRSGQLAAREAAKRFVSPVGS